tara:strand:- start:249 stop:629 length:381 start_codon:yes stop_codon:yes gene_type:complete
LPRRIGPFAALNHTFQVQLHLFSEAPFADFDQIIGADHNPMPLRFFAPFVVILSFQLELVAMERVRILSPLSNCRNSGFAPRFPTRMTLLMLEDMIFSFDKSFSFWCECQLKQKVWVGWFCGKQKV